MRGAKPERALDALARAAVAFPVGGTVLAACSGGPDSVALAALLDRIGRADGFDVVLAHVNAGLRESAWQDECVVLSVGARLGRPVRVVAPPRQRADEASLRAARYAALIAMAQAVGAAAIVTAHTAEDQTETILLALFRGTGLAGLAGIAPTGTLAGRALLRPLLRATHSELFDDVLRSGLPYALDPTNRDRRYRRNALRASLGALRAEFPYLDRSVARCAHIVREEMIGGERAERRRRLRARLAERGALRDIPFERIEAALDARPGGRVFLKPGLELTSGELHDGY